jgi:divalent metal cation (Fe/Co/Zn/Cd) transporter
MDADRATAAARRGVRLEQVGVAWMSAEALLAIWAGVAARSVLLTAFGFDSVIELLSGIVLLRRLSAQVAGSPPASVERLEANTTWVSGALLVLLCAYVILSSLAGLALGVRPSPSLLGLVVSAGAVVVMPALALAKSRVNRVLRSASLQADIAETISCAFLGVVTIAGLGTSMLFGLWWAQYVAALALLIWLVPETREALEAGRELHEG